MPRGKTKTQTTHLQIQYVDQISDLEGVIIDYIVWNFIINTGKT